MPSSIVVLTVKLRPRFPRLPTPFLPTILQYVLDIALTFRQMYSILSPITLWLRLDESPN